MLLLSAQLGLEANPVKPSALRKAHLGDLLHLAVVKLPKQGLLDLVDVLDIHLLFCLLDIN